MRNENKKKDITIYIVGVISFVVLLGIGILYYNLAKTNKKSSEVTRTSDFTAQIENATTNSTTNTTSQASSQIGKDLNETKNEVKEGNTVTSKIAVNTNNVNVEKDTKTKENNNVQTSKQPKENVEEPKKELSFAKPVEGEIVKEFAKDTLIYSNTLNEWTTHLGVDIKAERTTVVKAAEEGIVKYIKNDPRYGLTVVIEHIDGYSTVYANLLTSEFVVEGEKVEKGQSIGTVGNTAVFEISDESHLHFEISRDGVQLDPNIYLK